MTRTRSIDYVRIDGWRVFYGACVSICALGVAFVAGLVVGQQVPRPIPDHFEAPFANGAESHAVIDAPGQDDLFTFYESLEGENAAPVVPDVRPPLPDPGEDEVVDGAAVGPGLGSADAPDDDGIGETIVAAVDAPVRAVPRSDDGVGEAIAARPSGADDEAGRVLDRDAAVTAAAAPTEPTDPTPSADAGADTAIGEVAEASASARPLQRRVVREADAAPAPAPAAAAPGVGQDGARRYEVTVHEAGSWDDADLARQHLREAGLRATVVTRGTDEDDRSWAVVLRGEADEAEVARQERLASRVLRAALPRR